MVRPVQCRQRRLLDPASSPGRELVPIVVTGAPELVSGCLQGCKLAVVTTHRMNSVTGPWRGGRSRAGTLWCRYECSSPGASARARSQKGVLMRRKMLNGKIHRARVTDADLNYVGSVSIDPLLLKAADIVPNEQVCVLNLMNGARFETYAIEGTEGQICLNGAAARLAQVGDLVIILTYVDLDEHELAGHEPTVVIVDEENRPVDPA